MRNRQLKQQIISIFFIIFVFVVSLSSIDSGSVLLSKNGMDQPQLLLGAPYHEPDILSEGKIQNIRNTDVSSAKSSSASSQNRPSQSDSGYALLVKKFLRHNSQISSP